MIPAQVINSYSIDEGISMSLAVKRFNELEEFFRKAIDTNQPVSPSDETDNAWHHFLKYPNEYEFYCMCNFGVRIHHITNNDKGEKCYVYISQCKPEF